MITLEVHLCNQRRSIYVKFPEGTDEVAADFVNRRTSYAACAVVDEDNNDISLDYDVWPKLGAVLDPQCEHGLSANLCHGPNHYMTYDQERAYYGDC